MSDDLVVALAREMGDDDRVFIGINQPEVTLAAHLARRLWAPRLRFWASGQAAVDPARSFVARASFERDLVAGRSAFFWQARAFDEMGLRPPVCFAGGLQVDGRGNANLAGVADGDGWKLRGPGSAGLPSLTTWPSRFYIAVLDHDVRSLVEECSRISVLGDPVARARYGMAPDALRSVITPLATFAPSEEGLMLTEVVAGVTIDEVAERTGFSLRRADVVRERPGPTAQERAALAELRQMAVI